MAGKLKFNSDLNGDGLPVSAQDANAAGFVDVLSNYLFHNGESIALTNSRGAPIPMPLPGHGMPWQQSPMALDPSLA